MGWSGIFKHPNGGTGANQLLKLDGNARIPAGVDGRNLTNLTPGNITNPETLGRLAKISTGSFSGANTDISLPSGYDFFILEVNQLLPATAGVSLTALFTTNNFSSMLTSNNAYFAAQYVAGAGAFAQSSGAASMQVSYTSQLSNVAGREINGRFNIFPAGQPFMEWSYNDYRHSDGSFAAQFGNAKNDTASTINGVRFAASAGNLTGSYILYGGKNT